MRRILKLIFLLLVLAGELHSQVLIKAIPDKPSVLVGEPLQLSIEARLPAGAAYKWNLPDSLPHWEWIDKSVPALTENRDGRQIKQVCRITSYDTGYWVIPRMVLQVGTKKYYTDTVGIRVDYLMQNPNEDYHDIKEIEEVAAGRFEPWLLFGAGAVLIPAIAILLILRNRRKKPATLPELPKVDSLEGYLSVLDKGREQLRVGSIDVKQFYILHNSLLREYLEWKKGWKTREKTNEELVRQLRLLDLPETEYREMVQVLRLSDFVKFAKFSPAEEDIDRTVTVSKNVMTRIQNNSNLAV